MMKSKFLYLSLALIAAFHVQAYGSAAGVFSRVGNALFWVVKPVEVLDENDGSLNQKFDATKREIEERLKTFQDDDAEYCSRFDPRYRMQWRCQKMKLKRDSGWQDGADYKWKVMNEWKYGPLCSEGQSITKFIHRKRNAYVLSGLWYVVLAAGTAWGAQKVVSYLKKRKKNRKKQEQERFAQKGCAVPVHV